MMHLGIALVLTALTLPVSFAQKAGDKGTLLVIQKGPKSLGLIHPSTGSVVGSITENAPDKDTGHEVTASPDGKYAYVPIYGNSGVGKPGTDGRNMVVMDLATRKIIGNLDFGHVVRPHLPVFGKDGLLYVSTELDHAITVVDPNPTAPKILGTIPTGEPESHMFAISHDGRLGYTANVGSGTVSVLDIKARKLLTIIPVGTEIQRITVSMDDAMVFTSDQKKPELVVIDTATREPRERIPLPGFGYGSAATHDGHWLLVALPSDNKVAVVDLKQMKVVRTIDVAAAPQVVLLQPDGSRAFVSCMSAAEVDEVDLANWSVIRKITTAQGPDGMAWAAGQ